VQATRALVVIAAALGASVTVVGAVSWMWSRHLRRASATREFVQIEDVPASQWAIVPGARVRADGRPSSVLAERLAGALALLETGRARRVLVSGNNRSAPHGEVDVMVRWMAEAGVVEPVLVRDDHGYRTLDTMRHAAREHGIVDAVVCTQAFHLPRSLYLADAAGIDAVGLASGPHPQLASAHDATREQLAHVRALIDVELLGRAR
jgi:SanA protein